MMAAEFPHLSVLKRLTFSDMFTFQLRPELDSAAVATVSQQFEREIQRRQQKLAFTVKGHLSRHVPLH